MEATFVVADVDEYFTSWTVIQTKFKEKRRRENNLSERKAHETVKISLNEASSNVGWKGEINLQTPRPIFDIDER